MSKENKSRLQWTADAHMEFRHLYDMGDDLETMASELGRSYDSIKHHCHVSGLSITGRTRAANPRKVRAGICPICTASLKELAASFLEGNPCYRAECAFKDLQKGE